MQSVRSCFIRFIVYFYLYAIEYIVTLYAIGYNLILSAVAYINIAEMIISEG